MTATAGRDLGGLIDSSASVTERVGDAAGPGRVEAARVTEPLPGPRDSPRSWLQLQKGGPLTWHSAESTRTVASATYVDLIDSEACRRRPTGTTATIETLAAIVWLLPLAGAAMLDTVLPFAPVLLLLAYPIYLLLMAAVLAVCGVTRKDIAKWALKQANRQRVTDLIRAARALRAAPAADDGSATLESPNAGRDE